MNNDTHACGAFTRIAFSIHDGQLLLLIPRHHAVGERGDLVNTLITEHPGGPRLVDRFRFL